MWDREISKVATKNWTWPPWISSDCYAKLRPANYLIPNKSPTLRSPFFFSPVTYSSWFIPVVAPNRLPIKNKRTKDKVRMYTTIRFIPAEKCTSCQKSKRVVMSFPQVLYILLVVAFVLRAHAWARPRDCARYTRASSSFVVFLRGYDQLIYKIGWATLPEQARCFFFLLLCWGHRRQRGFVRAHKSPSDKRRSSDK